MSSQDAKRRVVLHSRFDTVTLAPTDLFAAIDLHRLHRPSIRDSLIVRAATNGNCTTLHAEVSSPRQVIESPAVSDPFAAPRGS